MPLLLRGPEEGCTRQRIIIGIQNACVLALSSIPALYVDASLSGVVGGVQGEGAQQQRHDEVLLVP